MLPWPPLRLLPLRLLLLLGKYSNNICGETTSPAGALVDEPFGLADWSDAGMSGAIGAVPEVLVASMVTGGCEPKAFMKSYGFGLDTVDSAEAEAELVAGGSGVRLGGDQKRNGAGPTERR